MLYALYYVIDSGDYEKFVLKHSEKSWAPSAMYYAGNLFLIIQNDQRAQEVYDVIISSFYHTTYYEHALYRSFYMAAEERDRKGARMKGDEFLEEFPGSEKAEMVRKRLAILKKGDY
ncbi:tol-pal system YbgF family protein [Elusimicrobiota bacterium]